MVLCVLRDPSIHILMALLFSLMNPMTVDIHAMVARRVGPVWESPVRREIEYVVIFFILLSRSNMDGMAPLITALILYHFFLFVST